jgi:hypothetical protein
MKSYQRFLVVRNILEEVFYSWNSCQKIKILENYSKRPWNIWMKDHETKVAQHSWYRVTAFIFNYSVFLWEGSLVRFSKCLKMCFLSVKIDSFNYFVLKGLIFHFRFHLECIKFMAKSAGYFFKCPFCNNNTTFLKEMKSFGVRTEVYFLIKWHDLHASRIFLIIPLLDLVGLMRNLESPS